MGVPAGPSGGTAPPPPQPERAVPQAAPAALAAQAPSQRGRILGTILLVALPLLTLALIVLAGQLRDGEARVARGREALVLALGSTATALVADHITALQTLALTEDLVNPARHDALPDLFQRIVETNATLDGVSLWDEAGWNVVTVAGGQPAPPRRSVSVVDRDYHRQVLATGQPHVSGALTARLGGTTAVFLSVPVTTRGAGRMVLSVALTLERLEAHLRTALPQPEIDLILVDGEGQAFVYPGASAGRRPADLRARPDVAATLAGRSGSLTVIGGDGAALLAAHAPVTGTPWGVILQQPAGDAFAAERREVFSNGALLALAVLFSAAIGWVLSGRLDVSYRRLSHARAQAEDARAAAEGAVTQRDALLAGVAHDLRNPLAATKGHAQRLRRRLERGAPIEPAPLGESLAAIETAVNSMTGMLNELLDAARLRSGRDLALNLSTLDVVALVRETVQAQAETAEHHRLQLETAVPSLVGRLDGPRLQRVLANLLANAVTYSPEGTAVRVALRRETRPEGDAVVVTVQDAGVGIPAADLPRIFEPFYRARNVADRAGGIGLGLAGSRKIVEQHGGTIAAASREGEGSLFTVTVPLGIPFTTPSPSPQAGGGEERLPAAPASA